MQYSRSQQEAVWKQGEGICSACGEHMSYEKFLKHTTPFRPVMAAVVLRAALRTSRSSALQVESAQGLDTG